MSHFSVLVIGPNVESQLAPYQENNMGDCPKEYLAFHESDECEIDEQTGKKGYWENPNAKWDWYQTGGRWTGFFKLKHGADGEWGEPGTFGLMAKVGTADIIRKGDIDFAAMRDEAGERAAEKYDSAMKFLSGFQPNKTWPEIRDEHKNIEEARTAYWNQPRCNAWKNEEKRVGFDKFSFGWDDSPDRYLVTREKFIQDARDGAGVPFAFVKDGKWIERGNMGWFACVSNEKDRETWNAMAAKMFDALPDDTELTLVDCHI